MTVAPYWPASMDRAKAAAYCGVTVTVFETEVLNQRLPYPSHQLGGKDHWRRVDLDKALDAIAGGATENWRDQLGLPRRNAA